MSLPSSRIQPGRFRHGYGALIAELDLTAPSTWARLSSVDRRPPAVLVCRGSDPQVEVALPPSIRTRLAGVLIELVVESNIDGWLEVFWDAGTGLSAEQSQEFALRGPGAGSQALVTRLPPGIVALRIDPLDRPGTVAVRSIRFYEATSNGAAHLPLRELGTGRPGWLDLPEVRQAVSYRLLGAADVDWHEWLFRRLLTRKVSRCLHLGAADALFGTVAVGADYVDDYTGVAGDLIDSEEVGRLPRRSRIRWASLRESLEGGPYDLILTTGFWSRTAGGPATTTLEAMLAPDGLLVLLERFAEPDEANHELLTRVLELVVAGLPPGWLALEPQPDRGARGCRPDHGLFEALQCQQVRPLGGAVVEPLLDRLQPEFFQLGAGTLLGAVTGAYLALEETLILTGQLRSPFNLVVASHRGARSHGARHLPTGWSVPATSDVSALLPTRQPQRS